ncbi:MAG: hypothetical protein AAGB26_08480 [Planctomycetota bacterium]
MLDRYDQDLLLDYLEDELDADRRAQLDALLEQDPQLAALLAEMAKDRAALRSLPEAEAPGDLVHDVTQTLERRMLLDEPVEETGPIPIARGRGLAGEPPRSISWARVIGLTGLAASVALAAGIVVITLDDPLERTADNLASEPPGEEAAEPLAFTDKNSAVAETLESTDPSVTLEGIVADQDGLARGITEGLPDEALALRNDPPGPITGVPVPPGTRAESNRFGGGAADEPITSVAIGSTGAISAIQPRQQLVLLTESPEVSFEQLMAFCVANGIPIVQPDDQAAFNRSNRVEIDRLRALRSGLEDADAVVEGNDDVVADYALLINESQLETLVYTLNKAVAIEPERAGKASLFSNQAALLEELPEDAYHQAAELRGVSNKQADAQQGQAQRELQERPELTQKLTQQQAVQLRLPPDLGSEYANRRNAYNLQVQEQQAGYGQRAAPNARGDLALGRPAEPAPDLVGLVAPEPETELERAPAKKAEDRLAQLDEAAEDAGDETGNNKRLATPKPPVDAEAVPAEMPVQPPARPAPPINPTRGNWLSAHLPAAEATPLLLQWRNNEADSATTLVPVTIQRAAPDKVNTLRLRQQTELSKRQRGADREEADAVTDSDNAEAEPTAQAEPVEPAESEPAEPAE